jgi:hypothetical protein
VTDVEFGGGGYSLIVWLSMLVLFLYDCCFVLFSWVVIFILSLFILRLFLFLSCLFGFLTELVNEQYDGA